MLLPYAEYQTTSSIGELISTVLDNGQNEIELAASISFGDDRDETDEELALWETCSENYFQYFKDAADEISKNLGSSLYRGSLPDPDAWKWTETLGLEANFSEIAVWRKNDRYIYLQIIWEDKDCPIVVSLGAR